MPKYPAVPGLTGSTLKQKQRIVGLLKKVCVDVRTSNVIISRCCLAQNELRYLLYVFFRHSTHKSNSNNNRFINGLSVVVASLRGRCNRGRGARKLRLPRSPSPITPAMQAKSLPIAVVSSSAARRGRFPVRLRHG